MCRLRNIVMRDHQESVTTGQTDGGTDGGTDGQTDAGQSDPYVPLCFAGDTIITAFEVSKPTHTLPFLFMADDSGCFSSSSSDESTIQIQSPK